MSSVASFFGLSTPLTEAINHATDVSTPDWSLNLEVSDMIVIAEQGPRDAIKHLRKRMLHKSPVIASNTLTLLETCVKNCGKRFHLYMANKDFLTDLDKIIRRPDVQYVRVKEKALTLTQEWADAFIDDPAMCLIVDYYQNLKRQGIEFPACNLDAIAPIHTPCPSSSVTPNIDPHVNAQFDNYGTRSSVQAPAQRAPAVVQSPNVSPGPSISEEESAKLLSELAIVTNNCQVVNDMLDHLGPNEDPSESELLQELNQTCRAMQERVLVLIDMSSHVEVLIEELLIVNDRLNNSLTRYEDIVKSVRQLRAPAQQVVTSSSTSNSMPVIIQEPALSNDLIDLGPDESNGEIVHNDVSTNGATPQTTNVGSDFDMFAATRNMTSDTSYSNFNDLHEGSIASAIIAKTTKLNDDFGSLSFTDPAPCTRSEGMSTDAFDQFLSQHLAPSVEVEPVSNSNTGTAVVDKPSSKHQVQMESDSDVLFDL